LGLGVSKIDWTTTFDSVCEPATVTTDGGVRQALSTQDPLYIVHLCI
jgi:hypothetical protein